jgi:negative regulator of flagellin synthesis FlgM
LKINPTRPGGVSGVQNTQAGRSTPQPSAASSATTDKVNVSSTAEQLSALETSLADVGVVDAKHVEAIKQAISEGRFNIDSGVVADKLLASVKEFLLSQKQTAA